MKMILEIKFLFYFFFPENYSRRVCKSTNIYWQTIDIVDGAIFFCDEWLKCRLKCSCILEEIITFLTLLSLASFLYGT